MRANYSNLSPLELSVHQTVEKYNMVRFFLNSIARQEARDFAEYLIVHLLPSIETTDDLAELDQLLRFVNTILIKYAHELDHYKVAG